MGLTEFFLMKLSPNRMTGNLRKRLFKIGNKYVELKSFEGMELFTHIELYFYLVLLNQSCNTSTYILRPSRAKFLGFNSIINISKSVVF